MQSVQFVHLHLQTLVFRDQPLRVRQQLHAVLGQARCGSEVYSPVDGAAGACYNEASIPVDAGGVRSAGRAQRDGSSAERPFYAPGFGRSPAEGRARGPLRPPVRGGLRPLLRFEAKAFWLLRT